MSTFEEQLRMRADDERAQHAAEDEALHEARRSRNEKRAAAELHTERVRLYGVKRAAEMAERDRQAVQSREDFEKKREADYKADQEQAKAAAEAAFKEQQRAAFSAANPHSDDDEFERLWPKIREQILIDRALRGVDERKKAARRSGLYNF